MKFAELDNTVQEKIIELLNDHIAATVGILKQDRFLLPMLRIPDSNQLVSLQSKDSSIDVDEAYTLVVEKLRKEAFTYALFSYSTRVGLLSGGESDALKTYIFTPSGVEVSFYTPYVRKGLFKKTIYVEKTILSEIKENVFG